MSDERPINFTGIPKKCPIKLGTVTTVDAQTGEVVETRRNAMTMLPPGPGKCPECATDHPHDQPHNAQSLYYQMSFYAKHGRYPSWTDAMSHCPEPVRDAWRTQLVKVMTSHGMPIPDDLKGGDDAAGGGR